MKPDEIKLRIRTRLEAFIDACVPCNGIANRLKNATFKFWIDQNMYRLDPILHAFCDQHGDIDVMAAAAHYERTMFVDGELRINLRELVPDEYEPVKELIPGKIILLKADDILDFLK